MKLIEKNMKSSLLLAIASILVSGCSIVEETIPPERYVFIEISAMYTGSSKNPDIVASPSYRKIARKTRKVAVKAPDKCYGRKFQDTDKNVISSSMLVKSRCGIEMSMIERKLMGSGYDVYSWEMLESKSNAEGKPFLEVAKTIGAKILFSVNSIKIIEASDSGIILQKAYFTSDKTGSKVTPVALRPHDKKEINKMLAPHESQFNKLSLGAEINITAIDTNTGMSVWIYKASEYDLKPESNKITAVFVHSGGLFGGQRWSLYMLNGQKPTQEQKNTNVEYYGRNTKNTGPIYQEYIQKAVEKFVTEFKSGG